MKNRKFLAGILAITLIFGLTIIGCDNDSKDDKIPDTSGRLTISGLANYNGKYVIAYPAEEGGEPPYLVGAASLNDTTSGKGGLISNGAATIKIWSVDIDTETLSGYSGNDQNVEILILIFETESVSDEDIPIAMETITVSFTNGVGSGTFPEAGGRLTITGLGDHNGKYVVAYRGIENYDAPPYLVGADTLTSATSGNATRISNNSAILKIWEMDMDNEGALKNYTGSDQDVELIIMIFNMLSVGSDDEPLATGKTTASFTNGIGSGTFVPDDEGGE